VEKAHMVGFGHLAKFFVGIERENIPAKGAHFEKNCETGDWKMGALDE
jgi:hypothetical protein